MARVYRFPAPLILRVTGPHSLRYLQARLTSDIAKVTVDKAVRAAQLTPQGRTEGLFTILKNPDESFTLYSDTSQEQILIAFKRYIVADRITVEDVSATFELLHVFPPLPTALTAHSGAELGVSRDEAFTTIARRRSLEIGADVLLPAGTSSALSFLADATEVSDAEAELERMRAAIPAYPTERNEKYLLSESRLDDVVVFGKGCYVGQEIIEKVEAVGRTARKLVALRIDSTGVAVDSAVFDGGGERQVGTVVSTAGDAGTTLAFAYIKTEAASDVEFFVSSLRAQKIG